MWCSRHRPSGRFWSQIVGNPSSRGRRCNLRRQFGPKITHLSIDNNVAQLGSETQTIQEQSCRVKHPNERRWLYQVGGLAEPKANEIFGANQNRPRQRDLQGSKAHCSRLRLAAHLVGSITRRCGDSEARQVCCAESVLSWRDTDPNSLHIRCQTYPPARMSQHYHLAPLFRHGGRWPDMQQARQTQHGISRRKLLHAWDSTEFEQGSVNAQTRTSLPLACTVVCDRVPLPRTPTDSGCSRCVHQFATACTCPMGSAPPSLAPDCPPPPTATECRL